MEARDPIGVGGVPPAADEYDGYVGGVARMIASGVSEAALAGYLLSIETDRMGLAGNAERAAEAAQRLVELRE